MNSPFVQQLVNKLTGVRELKRILETTVKDVGDHFSTDACQIILSNPLDPNVTSICEYRSTGAPVVPGHSATLPLVLQGRTFGSLTLSRTSTSVSHDELNMVRLALGELSDIIRLAQINDIVQRDTFRETFIVEIGNLMTYSLGIGDALFMVVNILGKALQVSRCLFICTDDNQAGWKCYEFWQQEKVQSLQQSYWPSADSALVAQTLLAREPLKLFEGQQNSYVSPAQEELQLINVKSFLGIALKSSEGTHGCVILQQCDYRRAWTRNEIDMVQNVADKVAEALYRLPAEKKAREPIMQLHQRIVNAPPSDGGRSAVDVRRALKGAMGQQVISQALPTGQKPPPPPPPKATPPAPAPRPTPVQASPTPAPQSASQPAAQTAPATLPGTPLVNFPASQPVPSQPVPGQTAASAPVAGQPTISPVTARGTGENAMPQATATGEFAAVSAPPAVAPADDPYADLDFGDFGDLDADAPPVNAPTVNPNPSISGLPTQAPAASVQQAAPQPTVVNPALSNSASTASLTNMAAPLAQAAAPAAASPETAPAPASNPITSSWGDLDSIGAGKATSTSSTTDAVATPSPGPVTASNPAASPGTSPAAAGASAFGNLDAIPTPGAGAFGSLDSIPTPTAAPTTGRGGLGGSMLGRTRGASGGGGPLKARLGSTAPPPSRQAEPPPPAAAPAVEVDEATAKAKLDQLLAAKSTQDATSDYVFATPGLDMRMLGRIDGWVSQIESKDKYVGGHARQTAEYSCAIARELLLSQNDIDKIRQAALLHELGKLGSSAQLLQKPEADLSDAELLLVMNHPMDGAELLESFPELKELAPVVRAVHEEFDGNGYPLGLKGEEIPLYARIIGAASWYHDKVAPKRSGEALDAAKIQQEMVAAAGKQFDPSAVQALIQSILIGKVPAVM